MKCTRGNERSSCQGEVASLCRVEAAPSCSSTTDWTSTPSCQSSGICSASRLIRSSTGRYALTEGAPRLHIVSDTSSRFAGHRHGVGIHTHHRRRRNGHGGTVHGTERDADSEPAAAPGELRARVVLNDDGGLSRRQVGRSGVSAAARRQRHRNPVPHRGLLGRRGTELEALVGLPIWTAYEPVSDAAARAPEKRSWWKRKRVWVPAVVALVIAAPLITGDVELFILNLIGLGIGALLLRRFMPRRPVRSPPRR